MFVDDQTVVSPSLKVHEIKKVAGKTGHNLEFSDRTRIRSLLGYHYCGI